MATEPKTFRIQLDSDARLAAAVGGAARCLADAAGLKDVAAAQLQSSIVAACREAFGHLTAEHPHLQVTLTPFPDRLEIALAHHGQPLPALGLHSIAGFAAQLGGGEATPGALAGVDRVQYESSAGETVTRLTKYLGHQKPKS